jgi:hypothetical protein
MQADQSGTTQALAQLWAQKYVGDLNTQTKAGSSEQLASRAKTVEKLLNMLRFCSSRAWSKTEILLFPEIQKHRINPDFIDPWKIAEDSRQLFEIAGDSYQKQLTPEQFSFVIARQCGQVRLRHTVGDSRLLGFLSMQFHYTGQFLLAELTPLERSTLVDYVKVMDDHLYMPLQRAYEAAAQYSYEAPVLKAVQQLLKESTHIAEYICAQVAEQNAEHRCYSGALSDLGVLVSSIRDVEMFAIYLCLCALEGNVTSVQQELFPLCVMLYPPLKVHWGLVRQLTQALGLEISRRLDSVHVNIFAPYLEVLQAMFSESIFPTQDAIWSQSPEALKYMDMAKLILQDRSAHVRTA